MIALIPVRAGVLPAGGLETVAECNGRALVLGEGAPAAACSLGGVGRELWAWETPGFSPGAWAAGLAASPLVAAESVLLLPASPDGRDLAPRLAHALDRPLFAGAIEVSDRRMSLSRWGGLAIEDVEPPQRFVATLVPGVRGVEARPGDEQLDDSLDVTTLDIERPDNVIDVEQLDLLTPDAASVDLSEAERIVAGGAGLDGAGRFEQLAAVATVLGASMGATRVVTDKGWVGHERQIGTTGVVVDPALYIALAISGAVQHTSGLGQPEHIVSVNVDGYCPMMQLADLAIVSDANAVLDELAARLLSVEAQPADA